MVYSGRAHSFGDNIDTDAIIAARYLNTTDRGELASHCFEDIDPGFAARVGRGDIIAAGENFGCGSSREHAPAALKEAGVAAVVAKSFARIFFRNCINIGLPIAACAEADRIESGKTVTLDLTEGRVTVAETGESFPVAPFPPFLREIIERGGLLKPEK